MQVKLFTIPAYDNGELQRELNSFLANHRILGIEQKFCENDKGGWWSFCIRYVGENERVKFPASPQSFVKKDNPDYKDILSPQEYDLFLLLKAARKEISADDGVLPYHAIINICHYYFEKFQIEDSFATRIGKGQYAALERAKENAKKYKYFCKLDCRKYFDSISHDILLSKLSHIFKDKALLTIFESIINSYSAGENRGVPIGNLTSQYFANFYLSFADRYAKQTLRMKGYVRYMDDVVIWHNGKDELLKTFQLFTKFLSQELNLSLKPLCLNSSESGLPFLGYTLFPNLIRLNKLSKKRFLRKCKNYAAKFDKGVWTQEEYALHTRPLFAFAQFADSLEFRTKMIKRMYAQTALTA